MSDSTDGQPYRQAIDLFRRLYADVPPENEVFVTSLLNDGGGSGERKLVSRKSADIVRFAAKWDQPGRGLFFAVNPLKPGARQRGKENCSHFVALWTDTDLKDIPGLTVEDILAAVSRLEIRPHFIISSGRGVHCYWLIDPLEATPENLAAVELALRQLADLVGGDVKVAEVARVMRFPGSHNTKGDGWREVVILKADERPALDFADVEEWLSVQSPVIERPEVTKAAGVAVNPYLAFAAAHGYKPALDVEEALAAMTYQGSGTTSIHETQLKVSASLISKGHDVDEVVKLLLDATMAAAGPYGTNWNWRREEAAIRAMCESARVKFPPKPAASVVSLKAVRQEKEEAKSEAKTKARAAQAADDEDKTPKFVIVGKTTITALEDRGEPLKIVGGRLWWCRDGVWSPEGDENDRRLKIEIQKTCEEIGINPTTSILSSAWKFITERPSLVDDATEWDEPGFVPFENVVVDVRTGHTMPLEPRHNMTRKLAISPGNGTPVRWFRFLADILENYEAADRKAIIELLQEWFGVSLGLNGMPRELRKALLLNGPSRTGKTQFAEVFRALFGERVCSQSVASLAERFGYSTVYGALAWIADDAIGSADDLADEAFKRIVTGERVSIDIKHRAPVEHRFNVPVLFTANALPRVRDATEAVYNRMIILRLDRVFPEDIKAPDGFSSISEAIIAEEMPFIAAWAMEGARRAWRRGRFIVPDCLIRQNDEFRDDNNPVAAWAKECVTANKYGAVDRRDLLASFNAWLREAYGHEQRPWGGRTFVPRVKQTVAGTFDVKTKGQRRVGGVALNDIGIEYFIRATNADPTAGSGAGKADVNKVSTKQMDEVQNEDDTEF